MKVDAKVAFPTDTTLEGSAQDPLLDELAAFYEALEERDLQPLWTQNKPLMPPQPQPRAVPWLWQKKSLWEMAERAGELITISRGGDRRVIALANPGLDGAPFTTPTLWAALQYLNPHESAPGHRHTPGAIRFVLEGEGTWTTVNGDACDMHEGDLILTPPWQWHDHKNGSDQRMVWFDGLDLPLLSRLDAIFFEQYPKEELQPVLGHNIAERIYAGKGTIPGNHSPDSSHSPLLVYRRGDVDAALSALSEELDGPLVSLDFVNPLNGESVLPTFGCGMHRLLPGVRTRPFRKTGSDVFVVFRGSGSTVINQQRFDWNQGDVFAVPSWATVDHEAHDRADLFSITDAPLFKLLGLYRGEELDGAQEVASTFKAK